MKDTIGTLRARLKEVETALVESHARRVGGTIDTRNYRLAPSGEGPLASEWADKPHRLVYDLCGMLEDWRQRAEVAEAALRQIISKLRPVQCDEPVCDGLIGSVLEVARVVVEGIEESKK